MLRVSHSMGWLLVPAFLGCGGSAATDGGYGGSHALQGGSTQGGANAGGTHVTTGGASNGSGGTHASSGGISAAGGSSSITSGTSALECQFEYTSKVSGTTADCHVSSDSQHSCADAATCICADPSQASGCYGFYMSPHGSASFTDFCAHSTTATTVRTLAEALTMMAASENSTVTTSADCSQIRAIL